MAQNLTQPSPREDEIDLREIIKILIESKKLIISSILIFTIASIIYSLSLPPVFKSSTILEIGYYEKPDGTQKLIEEPSDLISNLKIYQLLNDQQDSSFKAIENKLIRIETSSNKTSDNEKILSSMIAFIKNRHNELSITSSNLRKNTLLDEIYLNDSKLSFIKAKNLEYRQLRRSEIEDKIAKLKTALPIIDLEISQLEKAIIDDTNNLSLLKENNTLLIKRASNSPTLEQIIFNYKSKINGFNTKKYTNILETKKLNNKLKILENSTLQSEETVRLEQERKLLENQLQTLMNEAQVKTLPIGNIETENIKQKILVTLLLGLIIGFIVSIFLVLINNFIKNFRESEA
jgi:LPS O-antigen subunit length determinant protein (WzzB/FepE family)